MPSKQSRYKIETRNQPSENDSNPSVASGASAAQLLPTIPLGTSKDRTQNIRMHDPMRPIMDELMYSYPDVHSDINIRRPDVSDPLQVDIQSSGSKFFVMDQSDEAT